MPFKMDPNEKIYAEELTKCIDKKDPNPCKWHYQDNPGLKIIPGIFLQINFDFKYEVWDTCQGKVVEQKFKSLRVKGSNVPRQINWV